jgi:hypothetical protein
MKTSHIFWGILFIGLGLLILINNFSTLFMDWATIWKLWPLVVVLLGISLLVKHKYGKSFLGGLAAIILALAIFASFKTASHFFHNDFEIVFDDDGDYVFEKTEYSEEFDSTLQFATLNFDAGAGSFNISKVTENLFDATAEGKKDLFRLKRFDHDSTSKIDFDMHGSLSEFKIKSVDVDMGAASTNLKLGENYPETKVTIDAGASDVDMFVPEGSGCRIITDGALSSKHFDDFEKLKSDHYETAKFEEAENKIYIEIDSGVSSISVKRY